MSLHRIGAFGDIVFVFCDRDEGISGRKVEVNVYIVAIQVAGVVPIVKFVVVGDVVL